MAKRKTPADKHAARTRKAAGGLISCWATDPHDALNLRRVAAPDLAGAKLALDIATSRKPAPRIYPAGTTAFRYWGAAEALRRAADFWASVGCPGWHAHIGDTLHAYLDEGTQPNAYYAREDYPGSAALEKAGLSFYHFSASNPRQPGRQETLYFGESPDMLAHELGHAVLDSLQPNLYGSNTAEHAAFHEAFADISAVLTALELPEVREAVIAETQGQLWLNSVIARLGEEVGAALFQTRRDSDPDCLRNLSTHWVYREPDQLNNNGPNTILTNEPHNFSRVFSGAFLHALGHMAAALAEEAAVSPAHVLEASHDCGRLLIEAVRKAPLRVHFYQAVAEQLVIAADKHSKHGPAYVKAITTAMVRYGVLAGPKPPPEGRTMRSFAHAVAFAAVGTDEEGITPPEHQVPAQIELSGDLFGLKLPVVAQGPALEEENAQRPLGVMAALPRTSRREQEVQQFVENLARQGRIAMAKPGDSPESLLHIIQSPKHVTHRLELADDKKSYILRRIRIACGCGSH